MSGTVVTPLSWSIYNQPTFLAINLARRPETTLASSVTINHNTKVKMASSGELDGGISSGSIQTCILCGKPFTNCKCNQWMLTKVSNADLHGQVSSYQRHLAYCRRNANRPRKRGKPCQACSKAKAKCSFHPRCFRCVSKGVECVYDRGGVSTGQLGQLGLSTGTTNFQDLSNLNFGGNALLGLSEIPPLGQISNSIHFEDTLILNSGNCFPSDLSNIRNNKPADKHNELTTFVNLGQLSTPNLLIAPSPDFLATENFTPNQMVSIYTVGTLEKIRILDPVAQHGATLVMQALRAIPEKMLRRETFPLFIHPHPHRQALPEPLAICMRIAQIFATRTLDIRSFIWRTIKAEQARVLTEVNTLSVSSFMMS